VVGLSGLRVGYPGDGSGGVGVAHSVWVMAGKPGTGTGEKLGGRRAAHRLVVAVTEHAQHHSCIPSAYQRAVTAGGRAHLIPANTFRYVLADKSGRIRSHNWLQVDATGNPVERLRKARSAHVRGELGPHRPEPTGAALSGEAERCITQSVMTPVGGQSAIRPSGLLTVHHAARADRVSRRARSTAEASAGLPWTWSCSSKAWTPPPRGAAALPLDDRRIHRDLISQVTREGLPALAGRVGGRPTGMTPTMVEIARRMLEEGHKPNQVPGGPSGHPESSALPWTSSVWVPGTGPRC
jgi:hypothetical protein